jgi:hypothetical protein
MDLMKDLEELKGFVGREIEKANNRIRQNNGGITTGDLDIINKLTHSMKSLVTICAMLEDEEEGGYSGRGYAYRRGERRDGYSGRGGYMARERRDGGYSRTDIREHLNDMMNDAPDENTRMEIRRVIERMDQR